MTEERWQQNYNFPKPGPYEPVVMQCRTNRRSAWAAQLAQDAGLQNCYVYKQVRVLYVPIILIMSLVRRSDAGRNETICEIGESYGQITLSP